MIPLKHIILKYKWQGLKVYIKFILGRISYLRFKEADIETVFVPNYKQAIWLRKDSTDYSTFKQIFDKQEYNIPFDFMPRHIIDAGANIGLASIYFSNRFPDSKIYAIEPDDSNYKAICKNTTNYSNIRAYKSALHHSSNISLKLIDRGIGEWGFTTQPNNNETGISFIKEIESVSIQSIMALNNFDIIDILKMDIEGAEEDVFMENVEQWLPRVRCLIIEMHDRYRPGSSKRIVKIINKFNFSSFKRGENWVFINKSSKLI